MANKCADNGLPQTDPPQRPPLAVLHKHRSSNPPLELRDMSVPNPRHTWPSLFALIDRRQAIRGVSDTSSTKAIIGDSPCSRSSLDLSHSNINVPADSGFGGGSTPNLRKSNSSSVLTRAKTRLSVNKRVSYGNGELDAITWDALTVAQPQTQDEADAVLHRFRTVVQEHRQLRADSAPEPRRGINDEWLQQQPVQSGSRGKSPAPRDEIHSDDFHDHDLLHDDYIMPCSSAAMRSSGVAPSAEERGFDIWINLLTLLREHSLRITQLTEAQFHALISIPDNAARSTYLNSQGLSAPSVPRPAMLTASASSSPALRDVSPDDSLRSLDNWPSDGALSRRGAVRRPRDARRDAVFERTLGGRNSVELVGRDSIELVRMRESRARFSSFDTSYYEDHDRNDQADRDLEARQNAAEKRRKRLRCGFRVLTCVAFAAAVGFGVALTVMLVKVLR